MGLPDPDDRLERAEQQLRVTEARLAAALAELERRDQEIARLTRSHAALRQERELAEGMLASLPGVLYAYDQSGRFIRWNRTFEQATGYTAEEIAGMHPLEFIAEADRERVRARIEEVFATGASAVEAGLRSKDGRVTPYLFTGVLVQLQAGPGLIGVGIDVAQRTRAEDALRTSEARYRTLFESAPDGILIDDGTGVYLDANAAMCRMLGLRRDELVGMHARQIVAPAEVEHIAPALTAIKSERGYYREWTFRRADGATFPAEVIATVMPDGSLMAMIRDVTDRKLTETALRDLNDNLEAKVAARTEELHAALARAETADQVKSAFLATMSHELRTPLNSIIGFTGIILQGLAGPLSDEQARQLGMVRASARHLLALINDVLDLSKIEANQLEVRPEPFDLRASLDTVAAAVRPLADKKRLELVVTIAPAIGALTSDRRRVEQILLNLLDNAVKFTERGRVTLGAEAIELPGGRGPAVRIRVEDTGMGIAPDDLTTLFQPFRQVDTGLARQHEGTGLGLAICRRLAHLLGGEIVASSERGRGSTFTVVLPDKVATP